MRRCITLSRDQGWPLGDFYVEEEGSEAPENRLMGVIGVQFLGSAISLHVELIAVDAVEIPTETSSFTELKARDAELQDEVNTYYRLNGDENPALIEINAVKYVVLIYPFAE